MEEDITIGMAGTKQAIIDGLNQLIEEYGGSLTLAELVYKMENQYE